MEPVFVVADFPRQTFSIHAMFHIIFRKKEQIFWLNAEIANAFNILQWVKIWSYI